MIEILPASNKGRLKNNTNRHGSTTLLPLISFLLITLTQCFSFDHHHHHHPERGRIIHSDITAEELYSLYTQMRTDYFQKAFGTDHPWRILRQSQGIEIALLNHEEDRSCPYVRMSMVMKGGIDDVWEFLQLKNWDRTMPKMDPFYEGLNIVKVYRCHTHTSFGKSNLVEMKLARKRLKRLLTFGKRDFSFISVSDVPMDSGVWVSGTMSVQSPQIPRFQGFTRAYQDSIAFYEPLPSEDDMPRTRLTIICRIDLNDHGEGGRGGAIPMWIYIKTLGTTGIISFSNMRKEILKDVQRKVKELKSIKQKRPIVPILPWVTPKSIEEHYHHTDS